MCVIHCMEWDADLNVLLGLCIILASTLYKVHHRAKRHYTLFLTACRRVIGQGCTLFQTNCLKSCLFGQYSVSSITPLLGLRNYFGNYTTGMPHWLLHACRCVITIVTNELYSLQYSCRYNFQKCVCIMIIFVQNNKMSSLRFGAISVVPLSV